MKKQSHEISDELYRYVLSVSVREPAVLARLREETASMPRAVMQISPDQGQFMALITELMGARRYLEIGTYTGYSCLAVALALPDDGEAIACDISEEFTAVARRYWEDAGVADKIDLRLAPALDTLDQLIADGRSGDFDLAFIDADKVNYQAYLERAYVLLRAGGLLMVDNVLWGGSVINPAKQDEDTEAIRAVNAALFEDQRFSLSMVPLGDGLTLARKRP